MPENKNLTIGIWVCAKPSRLQRTLESIHKHTSAPYTLVLLPDGPAPATAAVLSQCHDVPQLETDRARGASVCFEENREESPLVSCIMPTHNRRAFVPQAIHYFLRQDYPHRELLIVDDGTEPVQDLVPDDPRIRYLRQEHQNTVGAKRNLACSAAQGEIIVHWDDDDWMADWRISYQVTHLLREQTDLCGLDRLLHYNPRVDQAWEYVYSARRRPWVAGGTLCYRKAFWKGNPFLALNVGEDSHFVWSNRPKRITALQDSTFYVALIHDENTNPKRTTDTWWHPYPAATVRNLMGEDWSFYVDRCQHKWNNGHSRRKTLDIRSDSKTPTDASAGSCILPTHNPITHVKRTQGNPTQATERPLALVTAASGIGDILRVTTLMRVFARLGYDVDVLLAPDYPEVVTLLEGASEIHQLFCLPSSWSYERQQRLDGLSQQIYDVATFTIWSLPLQRLVRAQRTFVFEQSQWRREGDIACVAKIARAVGWDGPLPAPFAMPSQRHFSLAPHTIALHPGCKPEWSWKKWHGFEELARLLPHVVIIGTAADLQNEDTYFRKAFHWPEHAKNVVGTLSLPDTAALLRECAALVSNDSGMMHLGVAMGIPTFGIFGITSPQREALPADHMFPITKGLPCEPACRQRPWGRRDCEYHLECLQSLTAQEVAQRIRQVIPEQAPAAVCTTKELQAMDNLNLTYYGYVFDASGYGHAARAYIHALHRAGITLSVVALANRARQVQDELVASLVGRKITPDFHLFHGIPPEWARLAFRLPNAIGMTVWETDTMPTQWRNILSHVLEVWLPSAFNVSVFSGTLETPIFKLPHPLLPMQYNDNPVDLPQSLKLTERDFVFYSIFEWQDRKGPLELLEAYLRAFPTEPDTLLLIKTNPGAVSVARQAVEKIRQQVRSEARVEICCEAWSDAHIAALHKRGDCYVSLHRGEGWGYPLFEAASRGTPVIATGYAGPLDYLHSPAHHLVRYELRQVQQPYVYYHPRMRWAEPDLAQAVERMRWVYANREVAREQAAAAVQSIQRSYSLEAVGAMARERLLKLLQRTQLHKWERLEKSARVSRLCPVIPISGDWYDADYFENGLKSNWEWGYTWPLFASLFQETAAFLTSMFSEATSYLDIGCAKGFLVRTLHELGKECWGFDHSQWAIEHAETCAMPYITQESLDNVSYDRQFDILLALSVFESLTEAQALSFLGRARAWTRQAIFATIPSLQHDKDKELCQQDDRDLSHITLQSRQWWHELFLRAGWRQDSLHRVVERLCQAHHLPTKMGWQVYVYAPA